jgi:hypothetical protein
MNDCTQQFLDTWKWSERRNRGWQFSQAGKKKLNASSSYMAM